MKKITVLFVALLLISKINAQDFSFVGIASYSLGHLDGNNKQKLFPLNIGGEIAYEGFETFKNDFHLVPFVHVSLYQAHLGVRIERPLESKFNVGLSTSYGLRFVGSTYINSKGEDVYNQKNLYLSAFGNIRIADTKIGFEPYLNIASKSVSVGILGKIVYIINFN